MHEMKLLWIVFMVAFTLQQTIQNPVSNSLVSLVDDALHNTIRVLYLVGLEERNVLERFLKLPYPKAIFDRHATIGRLDESCLVVLFVDMTNLDYSQTPFGETFSTVGELPWNAKVLVLVDDPYLYDGTAVVLLEQWFRHFAISYWSVTSVHGSAYLQYSLDYGNQFITVNGPLEFQGPYSYNRLSINYRLRIHAQALVSFPYTFITQRATFSGIDYTLFGHLFYYLKIDLFLIDVEGSTTEELLLTAVGRLARGEVDFMITRKVIDATHLPRVVIPDLLQPFTNELWAFIACIALLLYGLKFLTESTQTIAKMLMQGVQHRPINCFAQLTFNFIKFVLLESYLARVTSLLLVYRYEQDPETLEQFFATDIPIQMLPEHKTFIDTLAPAVSQAILNRAVLVSGLDKVSNTFAYIDSVGRATYTIALLQSLDPSTGRKLSYILPEPLATYPAAYLFARTAAPLRDCVAIHLDWMRAFGYVKLTDRMNNVLLDADKRRVLISEQLVHVEHMVPLLVFLALGWTISVVAFVGERFVYALEIIMQSREA